jgi:Rieske Fe-S protein
MKPCDRRGFVRSGATAFAAALLTTGCASLVARRVPLVDGRIRLSVRQHPELAESGGSLRLLPDGWTDPLYIVVLGEGSFAAVSSVCTHRGCTVDPDGPGFVCPCHGSEYDRQGLVLKGPASRNLSRYPVRTEGDELVIDVREAA